jgi:hypothetical protein
MFREHEGRMLHTYTQEVDSMLGSTAVQNGTVDGAVFCTSLVSHV